MFFLHPLIKTCRSVLGTGLLSQFFLWPLTLSWLIPCSCARLPLTLFPPGAFVCTETRPLGSAYLWHTAPCDSPRLCAPRVDMRFKRIVGQTANCASLNLLKFYFVSLDEGPAPGASMPLFPPLWADSYLSLGCSNASITAACPLYHFPTFNVDLCLSLSVRWNNRSPAALFTSAEKYVLF